MNHVLLEKNLCFGCGSCANICPSEAISIVKDKEGFFYPEIKKEKCINCGLCKKACPSYNEKVTANYNQQYFAVQNLDYDVVRNSSSGGMFTALAKAVLSSGGIVYGVAFDKNFTVLHDSADNLSSSQRFCGSKYIQSRTGDTFSKVANDLKNDRLVLFTGTPCQNHALKLFIKNKSISDNNLILCDFVCHGVGSPLIWDKYVEFLSDKFGELQSFNFRGKDDGWHNYYPQIVAGGRNISKELKEENSFFRLYLSSLITRPSCYSCRYTDYNRYSDLTLGDFWNIRKAIPEMDDDKGTSQVLVNSQKGQIWFNKCKDMIQFKRCEKSGVWQPHLEYPKNEPKGRNSFWKAFVNMPFDQLIKRYGKYPLLTKCRHKIMPLIDKIGLYVLAGKVYHLVFVRKK